MRTPTRALINILEQAAPLGYNTLNITGADNQLEELITTSHTLGYLNTITTNDTLPTPRILRHLDLVTISIAGKPQTPDQRSAFARMQQNITIINNTTTLDLTHILRPDSWQILSWLTDFAIQHKAASLHLHTNTKIKWSAIDLYRCYFSHYYLKAFAEPELSIKLDLLHRDQIINNPNFFLHQTTGGDSGFSTLFSKLTIDNNGDILPIPQSAFFRIGNIHDSEQLSTMIGRFMEEKLEYIMQLYNDTYREILADPGVEIFNWHQLISEKSKKFADTR